MRRRKAVIEIDIDDYLDQVELSSLLDEVASRGEHSCVPNRPLAQRLRAAFYRRDASLFEALLVAYLDPIVVKKPEGATAETKK